MYKEKILFMRKKWFTKKKKTELKFQRNKILWSNKIVFIENLVFRGFLKFSWKKLDISLSEFYVELSLSNSTPNRHFICLNRTILFYFQA